MVGVALVLIYSVLILSTTTLPSSIVVHAKIHKRPSSSDSGSDSGGSGSGTDSGSGGTDGNGGGSSDQDCHICILDSIET